MSTPKKTERERRVLTRLAWLGWTLAELAARLGVAPAALSRLLRHGLEYPGGKATWSSVADAMGVPAAALEEGGPRGPLVDA